MTGGKQRQKKRVITRIRKPQEGLHFLSGSKDELVRLTVYACHVHSQVFETKQLIDITHYPINEAPYGLLTIATEPEWVDEDLPLLMPIEKILAVLRAYNRFTVVGKLRNSYSRGAFWLEVYPPSAHERAEALLALSEWLDGKVSEEEKRQLLQLSDDVQV